MQFINCLIVDDHPLFAKGLESYILETEPSAQCFWVKNCFDAIDTMQQMAFDFVFVDIHLGNENGTIVVKEARQKSPESFCVAMSGDDNVFLARQMIKEGASSFISKALTDEHLCNAIVDVINKKSSLPDWLLNAPPSLEDELNELPSRLFEIVIMIVGGENNKVISLAQGITEDAVKSQIKRLYAKLDVSTRTEFMAKYAAALRNMEKLR